MAALQFVGAWRDVMHGESFPRCNGRGPLEKMEIDCFIHKE